MKSNIIVRADYYPNGKIIPISITFNQKTYFIKSCVETNKNSSDSNKKYLCNTINGNVVLIFLEGKWELEQ